MNRKYLDDIGVSKNFRWDTFCGENDPRESYWEKQKDIYGFDERETWCLECTFYAWLYERLRMFDDSNCINLDYHKFEYEGKWLNQRQCIDRMLNGCKIYLTVDELDLTEEQKKAIDDVAKIWAIVLPAMWW